jgi:tetratricopeptide (TPR) repeat protein
MSTKDSSSNGMDKKLEDILKSLLEDKGEDLEKTLEGLKVEDINSLSVNNLNDIWKKRVKEKDCEKEEYLEAEKIFEKIIKWKDDFAEAYHKLGNVYYRLKFYEEAEREYRKALKLKEEAWKSEDDKAWCYHDLGYLLYGARKYEEAIDNYNKAIEIAKKPKKEKSIAWFYIDLGTARMKLERFEDAEKAFNKALVLIEKDKGKYKDKAYVYNALGRLYYRKELYNTARKKLKLAKDHNPDLDKVYNNLGLLDFKEGLYENAKNSFQKAIEMDKSEKKECENLAEAHLNLGNVFFMEGKIKDAGKEYEEAIRIDRNSAEAYYSLGNLAAKNEEKERAEKLYREALRINPDYTKARTALEALDLPKEEGVDWWNWWFSGSGQQSGSKKGEKIHWWKRLSCSICGQEPRQEISRRKLVGGALIFILFLFVIGLPIAFIAGTFMPPSTVTYGNDTVYQKISIENMFDIDAKFENDLNNNNISKELGDIFKTKGFSISENATVRKENDHGWVITDGKKVYVVKKEEGWLNIYTGSIIKKISNDTQTFSNATTPRTIPSVYIWTLIGLAVFIFFILIFPQLKKGSVSIGEFKFEVETKDAGTSDIEK